MFLTYFSTLAQWQASTAKMPGNKFLVAETNIPLNRRDSFQKVIKEVEDFLNGQGQEEKQPESLDDMVHSVKNLSEY